MYEYTRKSRERQAEASADLRNELLKKKALEQSVQNTETPATSAKSSDTPANNTRSKSQAPGQEAPHAKPVSKVSLGNSILGKKVLEQSMQDTEQPSAPAQSSGTLADNT